MLLLGPFDRFLRALYHFLFGRPLDDPDRNVAKACTWAFVVSVLAFGFELTNPTLGIDDTLYLDLPTQWDPFWVTRGMWGGLLVHAVLPGNWIVPFVTLLLALLLYLLTVVVAGWVWCLSNGSVARLFILYSIYATFPFLAEQMAFSHLQVPYPLASFLVVASVALVHSTQRLGWRTWVALAFLVLGISTYQGSLSVLAVLIVMMPVFGLADPERTSSPRLTPAKATLRLGTLIGSGAALYYLLSKALLWLFKYQAQSEYYSVSLQFDFWNRLPFILGQIVYLLLGTGDFIPALPLLAFFGLSLTMGFLILTKRTLTWPSRLTAFAFLGASFIAPFSVLFIHEGGLAPRSTIGLGLLWSGIFALASEWFQASGRKIVMATILFVLASFVFHINSMFYSQFLVSEADRFMMNRIVERVSLLPTTRVAEKTAVIMAGSYTHPQLPHMHHFKGSVLGFSEFEWDSGNPYRMLALAHSMGLGDYDLVIDEDLERRLKDASHPSWPHPDSVFLDGNRVVVWLGEASTPAPAASRESMLQRLLEKALRTIQSMG